MSQMNRFTVVRAALSAPLLALALLGAAPSQAVTVVSATQGPVPTLVQGVIQDVTSNSLRIEGKTYALSSASTVVMDRSGKPLEAAKLVVGKTVAISVVQDGSQQRIKELWLIN
jgi:hypothetical protein